MTNYSFLKKMIEDLVVERDEWKKKSDRTEEIWKGTRERDEFNRWEAHLRGRKISKLQAEVSALKDDKRRNERFISQYSKSFDELKAENEALRKDAERYRWLRKTESWNGAEDHPEMIAGIWIVESYEEVRNRSAEELDSAVDHFIAKEKGE